MHSRQLLRATSLVSRRAQQSRGMAALKNYKRPSIEEMGVPTENWAQADAKRQGRYNALLGVGAVTFIGTVAFGFMSGMIRTNKAPLHLLDKKN